MFYTYVLYSLKSKGGSYTKNNVPFVLVFYEAFLAKEDSTKQEVFYKSGYGREVLNQKIEASSKIAGLVHR